MSRAVSSIFSGEVSPKLKRQRALVAFNRLLPSSKAGQQVVRQINVGKVRI